MVVVLLAADGQRTVFYRHLLVPVDLSCGDLLWRFMPRHRGLCPLRFLQIRRVWQAQLFALIQTDRGWQ
ncbi:hypothetical protein D3C76_1341020 [compost metagenome]